MLRMALALVLSLALTGMAQAQSPDATPPDRSATGGAQTLEDIMARQEGLKLDDSFRSEATGDPARAAPPASGQLGTLGGVSDPPELWRALRYDTADISTQQRGGPAGAVLVQDGGMTWLEFRDGPLRTYGGWLLLGMLAALTLFYVIHGRIKIDDGAAGTTVTRFKQSNALATGCWAGPSSFWA